MISHSKDRFIPIETFLEFQRMKQLQASFADLVISAKLSPKLELNADETLVRTVKPFLFDPKLSYRQICISNINGRPSIEDISNLLSSYGHVQRVTIRNSSENSSPKLIIVEFETEKEAKNAVLQTVYLGDQKLNLELLNDYQERTSTNLYRHRKAKGRSSRK